MDNNNSNSRQDYSGLKLNKENISKNPFYQFEIWLNEAFKSKIEDPNAMVLSTVSDKGKPSSRVVLLKSFDSNGFVFYSNYRSRKANQLVKNSFASLVFFWIPYQRQIRIEGIVRKLEAKHSDSYFNSRPKESKISAIVSPQSEVIPNRSWLENKWNKFKDVAHEKEIQRPEYWGGYLLTPDRIEFWQGRSKRLHDRLEFVKEGEDWKIQRLAP
ncbi:pyridoxamine 5'-phosphate oxidase [Bacteroidota bacterium]